MVKIYLEKQNKTHGWALDKKWLFALGLILFSLILSPTSSAQPPESKECLIYAYTESLDHTFLLETNKSAFGSNMTIVHNCEYIEVYVNSNFTAYTNEDRLKFPLQMGYNDITIITDNYTKEILNVLIYPDRLSWSFEYNEWQNSENDYTFDQLILRSKVTAEKNWVSILSVTTVFTLVTMVYWNLINAYVDRNFCEEVKN